MELFEYKRYFGSEEQSKKTATLGEYLKTVKERKRKRVEEPHDDEGKRASEVANFETNFETVSTSKNKKKKQEKTELKSSLREHIARVEAKKKSRGGELQNEKGKLVSSDSAVSDILQLFNTSPSGDVISGTNESHVRFKKKRERKSLIGPKSVDNDENPGSESGPSSVVSKPKGKNKKKKKKSKTLKLEKTSSVDDIEERQDLNASEKETPAVRFEVLGAHSFNKKPEVKRVLPRWLAEPTIISRDLNCDKSVADVGKLHRTFLSNLESMGVNKLFPVQAAVIPRQLRCFDRINYLWPRDLCVSAPTGSGKTLAYVLPILQAHFHLPCPWFYALVVVPVQELALQVSKVFTDVAKGTGIKIGCVTGGTDREAEAKTLVFKRDDGSYSNLINILVATPGRLLEHFYFTPGFSVNNLQFIVIDEADKVVEQKSLNWLYVVEKQCNPSLKGSLPPVTFHNLKTHRRGPQKLLFSATLSQDPEKLLKLNLFQPQLITSVFKSNLDNDDKGTLLGKFSTPDSLKESYAICDLDKKPLLIHKLLKDGWRRILIFTKTCVEANRLSKLLSFLNNDIKIAELSTLMTLEKRRSTVNDFTSNISEVLVCSNRMARGIDIKEVDYVIIYNPPKHAKGYIHQVGRTGRAGLPGTAVTIVTQKECKSFLDTLNRVGKTGLEMLSYDVGELEIFMDDYNDALEMLKDHISYQRVTSAAKVVKAKRTKFINNIKKKKNKL